MSTLTAPTTRRPEDTFLHEALMYAGEDGFLDGTLPFIRDAVAADEPILVAVSAAKIARLRNELGGDAQRVRFADMAEIGANPAHIIPAWHDFVTENAGRRMRGIGEPIHPGRGDAELVECHRHEALLNLAFEDAPGFWLMCPYDTTALDPAVVEDACCTHPHVSNGSGSQLSEDYSGNESIAAPFADPLPPPPRDADEIAFDVRGLPALRKLVESRALDAGLDAVQAYDLTLAMTEIATNSVRHSGGDGVLRIWSDHEAVLCQVSDGGWIDDPLAGRRRPSTDGEGGYGLWLANQLCNLVQVRAFRGGSVVRLHMRRT